jgi:hypothetical protein
MVHYTSKTGVWNVDASEEEFPVLVVKGLSAGTLLKVTCQFFSRTMTDDLGDGYEYRLVENGATTLITLTPDGGLVQGSDSWQLFTHVVLFEVPASIDHTELALRINYGGMNGQGSMMNLTMIAETVS